MGLDGLLCDLTCGNCRGRSSSLSKIMQIVASTVRVKHLCEDVRMKCELSFVVFLATSTMAKAKTQEVTSAVESAISQAAATASEKERNGLLTSIRHLTLKCQTGRCWLPVAGDLRRSKTMLQIHEVELHPSRSSSQPLLVYFVLGEVQTLLFSIMSRKKTLFHWYTQ